MQTKYSFSTPVGLKIRLNHKYFFYLITQTRRNCTDEEIKYNDTMYGATKRIEELFVAPTVLVQVVSIVALLLHASVIPFCIIAFICGVFGCLYRCAKQYAPVSFVIQMLSRVYLAVPLVWYTLLIVLVFVCDAAYLVAPYALMRLAVNVVTWVMNYIVIKHTHKKYGVAYMDTEICAFRVFHKMSDTGESFPEFIESYQFTMSKVDEGMPLRYFTVPGSIFMD